MAHICDRFDSLGFDGIPRRLGIMGGTFDPVHIGHLACAEQAREAYGLDAVVFVPAGVPVFKKARAVTPAQDRLAMCRLSVASNPAFDVSALEIERGGDTYTVDTLRELRAHYPSNVELFFITGADAVVHIVKWRESAAIANLAHLIAVTRPGYALTKERMREIEEQGSFDVSYLEVTALAISSSDLRSRVAEGRSIRYLTMQGVYDYVRKHGLYREDDSGKGDAVVDEIRRTHDIEDVLSDAFFEARAADLAQRLGHGRFEHSQGVAKTAQNLARLYQIDECKARLAGLLHDWDKSYDDKGIRERVEELGLLVEPFVFENMPQLLHGPTAAAALAREFPALPRDIVQSIERHTAGAVDMSDLDMIVYIADALEPGRDYHGLGAIRGLAGEVALEELYVTTFQHVLLNLVERRKRIHPQTVAIWNYYIARSREAAGKEPRRGTL